MVAGNRMSGIDEPVTLSEYQASWPLAYETERQRLSSALGGPAISLEHIGSTAVPGMVAKPIVDLMLGVGSFPPNAELMQAIEGAGYASFGEAGVPGRLYCRYRGAPPANLHVVLKGGTHWFNNLALREYLRGNAAARDRYADAKRAALASGACSLLAFSTAKAGVIGNLLQEAVAAHTAGQAGH